MKSAFPVKAFCKQEIEFQRELGAGAFGKVIKGVIKSSEREVAIKVFHKENANTYVSKIKESAKNELAYSAFLSHRNIVKLLGFVQSEIPWLIFEYMKDGNLRDYVIRKGKQAKEKKLLKYCLDICEGMAFLHKHNFIHKDLAARNILLDGKTAKIADLGLTSFLPEQKGHYSLTGKLFPFRHAGPECIIEGIYTKESDVWSFGVLLFEVFSQGATAYGSHRGHSQVRRLIACGKNPENVSTFVSLPENVKGVMNSIFRQKLETRPSFEKLKEFFKGGKPLGTEMSNAFSKRRSEFSQLNQPDNYFITLEQELFREFVPNRFRI